MGVRLRLGAAMVALVVGCAGPAIASICPLAQRSADAQGPPSDESLVLAHVAAWNAGDVAAVAALFAPDAEVIQHAPWIEDGGDRALIRDVYGAEVTIDFSALTFRGADIVWASDRNDVRRWAAELLRNGHHVDVAGLRTTGDGGVAWSYRASTSAQRRLTGIGSTAGAARATVSGGLLRSLVIESDVPSVQERLRHLLSLDVGNMANVGVVQPAAAPTAGPPRAAPISVGPTDGDARAIVLGSGGVLAVLIATRLFRSRRA